MDVCFPLEERKASFLSNSPLDLKQWKRTEGDWAGISSVLFLFSASGSQLCHSTGSAKALFMAYSFKGFLLSLVGCWKPNRARMGRNCGKNWETEGEGQSWQRDDLGRGLLQCGDFVTATHSAGRGKKRKEWNSRE